MVTVVTVGWYIVLPPTGIHKGGHSIVYIGVYLLYNNITVTVGWEIVLPPTGILKQKGDQSILECIYYITI